jgi:hypothetical protein
MVNLESLPDLQLSLEQLISVPQNYDKSETVV